MERRHFFGSMAAAGVGAMTLDFSPVVAQGGKTKKDPVLEEVWRQARAATRAATRTDAAARGGEPLRGLAAAMRTLAAHGQAIGLDAAAAAKLRSVGRKAVLSHRPDLDALAAHLKAEGIEVDRAVLGSIAENPAGRAKALDDFLKNGASASLLAVAETFERHAAKLDEQRGSLQVVRAQYPDHCGTAWWDLFTLELLVIATCTTPLLVVAPELCATATAGYITLKFGLCYIWGCCY